MDGYDEISLTSDTKIITKNTEEIFTTQDLGFNAILPESIQGGKTPQESAQIFRNILEGNGTDSQNSVVLANAAVALQHTHKFGDYQQCLHLAKESLESKKALACLQNLIK